MLTDAAYNACVAARRSFSWPGFSTYSDVGLDGDYVTPYHLSCNNRSGPVLISFNWLDAPTALRQHDTLCRLGYLPQMLFNSVLDSALRLVDMTRSDIYLTHAVHLLPPTRSANIAQAPTDASFDLITRHEIAGRATIALGRVAGAACARAGIDHVATIHPSARGLSHLTKARSIAEALKST